MSIQSVLDQQAIDKKIQLIKNEIESSGSQKIAHFQKKLNEKNIYLDVKMFVTESGYYFISQNKKQYCEIIEEGEIIPLSDHQAHNFLKAYDISDSIIEKYFKPTLCH